MDFINEAQLIEIPHRGDRLSWCKNILEKERIYERLDRELFSDPTLFNPSLQAEYLERVFYTDHSSIILSQAFNGPDGPIPFKFQNMWCLHEDLNSFVQTAWNQIHLQNPLVRIVEKLKHMKLALKC